MNKQFWTKRAGCEWILVPALVVVILHFLIWLIVSFIYWDFFFITFFGHRVIFVILVLFTWYGLRSGDREKKGDAK